MRSALVAILLMAAVALVAWAEETPTPDPTPTPEPAGDATAEPQTAEDFFEVAVTRFQQGDLAGAERNLRTALALRTRYAEAHYLLGRVMLYRAAEKNRMLIEDRGGGSPELPQETKWAAGQTELQEALGHLRTAIGLEPASTDAWLLLATCLDNLGQEEEAESAYKQTINLDPASANARDAHNNLGLLYVTQEKWAEAKAQFDEALTLDPAFNPARINLEKLRQKKPKLFK